MQSKAGVRVMATAIVVGVIALTVGACTRAEDGNNAGPSGSGSVPAVDATLGENLMWNDGACDAAKPTVKLGMIVPFAAGAISLKPKATAAEVSAKAFNARGGIGGRCIEMITCDEAGDPNKAADCARDLIDAGVVAQLNDGVVSNAAVVYGLFDAAGIPRLDGNPLTEAFGLDTTFTLSAGGIGVTVMMLVPLPEAGVKEVAIIRADVPAAAILPTLLEPAATALGLKIVADIPVTVGTSDYSQFVLAAKDAGAQGVMMATGNQETIQVLRAAEQLDSDLTFSLSLGSVSQKDVAQFGAYADHLRFSAELPAPSSDPTPYPLLAVADRELAASGDPTLQIDTQSTSTLASWVLMYALVKMLRDAKVTDVTKTTVFETLKNAKDVDLNGLAPKWTPNRTRAGLFKRTSNPFYWIASWDVGSANFVMGRQVDAMAVFEGKPG